MRQSKKHLRGLKAFLMAMVLLLNMFALPCTGLTAEAASKKVTIKKVTSVNSLTGSKTIKLAKGKKATLKTAVTVTPNKAANKKVTYKSSNPKIAKVSKNGVITGKKAGTAKITVTSGKNSKKKAIVTVKVMKGKVTSIKLSKTFGTFKVGDTKKPTATVHVSKGGSKDVVWKTSDKTVATVSKKGIVRAVGVGTTVITVRAADGTGIAALYGVNVKKSSTANSSINTSPRGSNVIYHLNGGVNDPRNPNWIKAGVVFQLYEPTRDRYCFDGWYLKEDFSRKTNRGMIVAENYNKDLHVYAKWEIDQDAIPYDPSHTCNYSIPRIRVEQVCENYTECCGMLTGAWITRNGWPSYELTDREAMDKMSAITFNIQYGKCPRCGAEKQATCLSVVFAEVLWGYQCEGCGRIKEHKFNWEKDNYKCAGPAGGNYHKDFHKSYLDYGFTYEQMIAD